MSMEQERIIDMKVYIVYRLVGRLGIADVVGVFSTLEKAQEYVTRYAKHIYIPSPDYVDVEEFADDNFTIEKWFVDTNALRGADL